MWSVTFVLLLLTQLALADYPCDGRIWVLSSTGSQLMYVKNDATTFTLEPYSSSGLLFDALGMTQSSIYYGYAKIGVNFYRLSDKFSATNLGPPDNSLISLLSAFAGTFYNNRYWLFGLNTLQEFDIEQSPPQLGSTRTFVLPLGEIINDIAFDSLGNLYLVGLRTVYYANLLTGSVTPRYTCGLACFTVALDSQDNVYFFEQTLLSLYRLVQIDANTGSTRTWTSADPLTFLPPVDASSCRVSTQATLTINPGQTRTNAFAKGTFNIKGTALTQSNLDISTTLPLSAVTIVNNPPLQPIELLGSSTSPTITFTSSTITVSGITMEPGEELNLHFELLTPSVDGSDTMTLAINGLLSTLGPSTLTGTDSIEYVSLWEPFICDGRQLVVLDTDLGYVEVDSNTNQWSLQIEVDGDVTVNSIGFNSDDGLIYGALLANLGSSQSTGLVRFDRNYLIEYLGNIENFALAMSPIYGSDITNYDNFYNAGDWHAGFYYMAGNHATGGIALKIDLNSREITQVYRTPTATNLAGVADFAIDPTTGILYFVSCSAGACSAASWNLLLCPQNPPPAVNDCDPASFVKSSNTDTDMSSSGIGFFDSFGHYYAMHNSVGKMSMWDVTVSPYVRDNLFDGTVFGGGDGASCPAPFRNQRTVLPQVTPVNSFAYLENVLSSPLVYTVSDMTFSDDLTGTDLTFYTASSVLITGNDPITTPVVVMTSTLLTITDITTVPGIPIVISYYVNTPNFDGSTPTQSIWGGVPARSGGPNILSDDPTLPNSFDPTVVTYVSLPSVSPPFSCDGTIQISYDGQFGLLNINLSGGTYTLSSLASANPPINGLGYRTSNDVLYGVSRDNQIVTIDSNYDIYTTGPYLDLTGNPSLDPLGDAADFSGDLFYIGFDNAILSVVDVSAPNPRVTLEYSVPMSFNPRDFIIEPVTGEGIIGIVNCDPVSYGLFYLDFTLCSAPSAGRSTCTASAISQISLCYSDIGPASFVALDSFGRIVTAHDDLSLVSVWDFSGGTVPTRALLTGPTISNGDAASCRLTNLFTAETLDYLWTFYMYIDVEVTLSPLLYNRWRGESIRFQLTSPTGGTYHSESRVVNAPLVIFQGVHETLPGYFSMELQGPDPVELRDVHVCVTPYSTYPFECYKHPIGGYTP